MPLVINSQLPSFKDLQREGGTILTEQQARQQDIRELHIGLLNMMPDKALTATERQFFRLIGESNQIAQFYMHPFTLKELARGFDAKKHIDKYYKDFDQIKAEGLDALIITGANVVGSDLSQQIFWEPLTDVLNWSYHHVTSTLCSCLATHAVLEYLYDKRRSRLPKKRWGVFPHRVADRTHALVSGVNTRFNVPHSRYNEVDRTQFTNAGLQVLVESEQQEVHLAVSKDGFRLVFFQGHPEYDVVSLLKEYRREIGCFISGERQDYPVFPENYFNPRVMALLLEYHDRVVGSKSTPPLFPEDLIIPELDNTWHDSAEAIMNNWVGNVYQVTDLDRHTPFAAHIDPEKPLSYEFNE